MAKLLNEKELIERYGGVFNHNNLYELRRAGKIPVISLPNKKRYFYNLDSIERWLQDLEKKNSLSQG